MSNLNDERTAIAGKLTAAGCKTTLDPRCVPPAVLVAAPSVTGTEGIGGWSVQYPIHILAAPPGNEDSLVWMLSQLELVLITFPGSTGFPTTVAVADTDVPAYTVTLSRSVANPNC